MDNKNVENNGGYQMEDIIWHQHSNLLLRKIIELWPDKSRRIVDLGCGHNFYANTLNLLGYKAAGVDMVPYPGVFCWDITSPVPELMANEVPENILSLEVGEHIPPEKADNYLDRLCRSHGDVILSWAVPGQEGIGHINCQPNEWVIEQMEKRGYKLHAEHTEALREEVKFCHCNWFKNTLMYFTKK